MHDMPEASNFEEERRKRKAVLKRRLKALPQDNPIVKAALDEKDRMSERKDKQDKWEVVENLQFTAYNEYFDEDKEFEPTVKALAQALTALVS